MRFRQKADLKDRLTHQTNKQQLGTKKDKRRRREERGKEDITPDDILSIEASASSAV